MDYEKKYNEAVLRADEAVQKGCLDKDMFDIIFPPEEIEEDEAVKWLVDDDYDELEKELDRYLHGEFQQTAGGNFNNYIQVARHFSRWGAEHLKK